MRLQSLLLKPAELWRMGLEQLKLRLGYGSKSRRLAEQQATINQLRSKLHEADKLVEIANLKVSLLTKELELERKEHHKQKNATEQMWKFIHTRHRLDVKAENGSIRELLSNLDKR